MQDVLSRPAPPYDARLKYGADSNQFGDLRLPKAGDAKAKSAKHPMLVMIHGGFWRAKYDLVHTGSLCAALTQAGFVTFNLEYRRVGNPGGGWPGSFEDVIAGYRYIYQRANDHNVDPKRTLVMGHSAGGQLSLCLAKHEPHLKAAISLAGVVDVRRAWELKLSNNAATEFMHGSPDTVPEHFHEGSPTEIAIPKVQQLLVHGAKDDIVPIEFSQGYVRTKKLQGEHVRLLELPDAGHFEVIDPQSSVWPQILKAIQSLV